MKTSFKKQKMHGYITLVVVIIFVPFLLLQGINLINFSIDITNLSGSAISNKRQHIDEQSCWEEILYFLKNNSVILGPKQITVGDITCDFLVENIIDSKYKITLESRKDGFYSHSNRYILYSDGVLEFIASQE